MTEAEGTVTATAPPGGTATAISSEPVATQKVVEHGEASRMPDTSWTWRRILIFGVAGVASYMLWRAADSVTDVSTLKVIIKYGFYTLWLALILYGVGATVTDLAKLAAAVKTTRRETVSTQPPSPAAPAVIPAAPRPAGTVTIPRSIP